MPKRLTKQKKEVVPTLSVAEQFYLEKNREVPAKVLAKTLNLSLSKVEGFLNGLPPLKRVTEEQVELAKTPTNGRTLPENQMVKHRGAVIMTKSESERLDEAKPKTTRTSRSYVTTAKK